MRKEPVIELWTVVAFLATLSLSRAALADKPGSAGADAPTAPVTRDSTDDGADLSDASSGAKALPGVPPPRNSGESKLPGGVKATPLVDPFETRRLALEAHLGLATPVGMAGFIAEYSVFPFLGLGAGVGVSPTNDKDSTVLGAVVVRLRPLRVMENALVLGGAYSFGRFHLFEWNIGDTPSEKIDAPLGHFAQVDIGWERRSRRGFLIRLGMGAAFLLNSSDLTCMKGGAPCVPPSSTTLVTFDMALGYAF